MCELDHESGALKFQVLQPASQTQGIYPGSRQQCQMNLIIFLEQRFWRVFVRKCWCFLSLWQLIGPKLPGRERRLFQIKPWLVLNALLFIITLKNSNSTHRKFCLVKQVWGRTDAELYFSPHHSFYSAQQTTWQGSTAAGTWEGQPEQQRLCPHNKVIWCKKRSRSVGQKHLLSELAAVLEEGAGWPMSTAASPHVCTGSACRTGSAPGSFTECFGAHLRWSTTLYSMEKKFRILIPRTGWDPNCMWGKWKDLPSHCTTALNQNTPSHTTGIRTTGP